MLTAQYTYQVYNILLSVNKNESVLFEIERVEWMQMELIVLKMVYSNATWIVNLFVV